MRTKNPHAHWIQLLICTGVALGVAAGLVSIYTDNVNLELGLLLIGIVFSAVSFFLIDHGDTKKTGDKIDRFERSGPSRTNGTHPKRYGAPDGIRTRVLASKGPNDWPLHYRSPIRPI